MEVELKYIIAGADAAASILGDDIWNGMEEPTTRVDIPMRAIYYDTANRDLKKYDMAFRIRYEGNKKIATLKRGGSIEGALHIRNELNAPVCNEEFLDEPTLEMFADDPMLADVDRDVVTEGLSPIITMDFDRKCFKIDYKDCLIEVSVDQGYLRAGENSEDICEMELELYSGDQERLVELGEILQERFDLRPGTDSKYARGLGLMQ